MCLRSRSWPRASSLSVAARPALEPMDRAVSGDPESARRPTSSGGSKAKLTPSRNARLSERTPSALEPEDGPFPCHVLPPGGSALGPRSRRRPAERADPQPARGGPAPTPPVRQRGHRPPRAGAPGLSTGFPGGAPYAVSKAMAPSPAGIACPRTPKPPPTPKGGGRPLSGS